MTIGIALSFALFYFILHKHYSFEAKEAQRSHKESILNFEYEIVNLMAEIVIRELQAEGFKKGQYLSDSRNSVTELTKMSHSVKVCVKEYVFYLRDAHFQVEILKHDEIVESKRINIHAQHLHSNRDNYYQIVNKIRSAYEPYLKA